MIDDSHRETFKIEAETISVGPIGFIAWGTVEIDRHGYPHAIELQELRDESNDDEIALGGYVEKIVIGALLDRYRQPATMAQGHRAFWERQE